MSTKSGSFLQKVDTLILCFEQMPGIYANLPNEVSYQNHVIAFDPDGEELKFNGKDLHNLLKDHLPMNENSWKIFKKTEKIISFPPDDIGLKTTLLMNSGVKTIISLNFSNRFDKKPIKIYDGGDGTLAAYGYEWVCKNWKNITCIDFKKSGDGYRHSSLVSNVLDFISNLTYNNPKSEFRHDEK